MKYYSTRRPVAPGSYPKPQGNKVLEIRNYDSKTYCEEIGREAWGYIEYELPVSQVLLDNFELVAVGVGCTGCVHEMADRDMDCCWDCSRNRKHSKRDMYRHKPVGGDM